MTKAKASGIDSGAASNVLEHAGSCLSQFANLMTTCGINWMQEKKAAMMMIVNFKRRHQQQKLEPRRSVLKDEAINSKTRAKQPEKNIKIQIKCSRVVQQMT